MYCANCGTENHDNAWICLKCGKIPADTKQNTSVNKSNSNERKTMLCPFCNKEIGVDASFCLYCGKKKPQPNNNDSHKSTKETDADITETLAPISVSVDRRGVSSSDMSFSNIILFISGALGIISFFFPFFGIGKIGDEIGFSGYGMVKQIYNFIALASKMGISFSGFLENVLAPLIKSSVSSSESVEQIVKFLIGIFIITGPIIFGLLSARILLRAFSGKGYAFGLVVFIIYTVLCFALVAVMSSDLPISISFFSFTTTGYWLTLAAMLGGSIAKIVN